MMPTVFYASMAAEKESESLLEKIDRLCEKVGISGIAKKGGLVAVKLHFGESGIYTFTRPIFVSRIVSAAKAGGCMPFLTDSNTLYVGSRSNAVDHIDTATMNGFTRPAIDAPVLIADGLHGHDYRAVAIKGEHFKSVKIGSAIAESDAVIGIAHFKGHMVAGFGGQIKNIGMGSGSRAGKQQMHSDFKPEIDRTKCKGCGRCLKNCPEQAIVMLEGKAKIDLSKCAGCGECAVTCTNNGIKVRWDSPAQKAQEKMAEYALGVVQGKKCAFFNFVMDITPECDCMSWSGTRMGSDVGILASQDCVAIDQASVDLIVKQYGKDPFADAHKIDWSHQLKHGEKIGLGSRKYSLEEV